MSGAADDVRAEIVVDEDADALCIRFAEKIGAGAAVSNERFNIRSRESDVVFDFDSEGHLLGIEIIGIDGLFR